MEITPNPRITELEALADAAQQPADDFVERLLAAIEYQQFLLDRLNFVQNVFPGHQAAYRGLLAQIRQAAQASDDEALAELQEVAASLTEFEDSIKDIHSWLLGQDVSQDQELAEALDAYNGMQTYIDSTRSTVADVIQLYDLEDGSGTSDESESSDDEELRQVEEEIRGLEEEIEGYDRELERLQDGTGSTD